MPPPASARSVTPRPDGADPRPRCARSRPEPHPRLDARAETRDLARAWRTVPLGSSALDPCRTPAVDLEVWVLHVRFQRTGSRPVLTQLVEEYSGYALSIARRLQRHGETGEDLGQVAMEALVTALRRFDVERRRPFAAFATPTISGAIKRHYRDRGWGIRTSRSIHETAGPLRDARERLAHTLGRTPTAAELAGELHIDAATIVEVDRAVRAREVASLDRPATDGGPELSDAIGEADANLALAENRVALVDAIAELSDRDRTVLHLYYFEDLSQREVAERLGVSQMQVSRWLTSIIARLRGRLVPA